MHTCMLMMTYSWADEEDVCGRRKFRDCCPLDLSYCKGRGREGCSVVMTTSLAHRAELKEM